MYRQGLGDCFLLAFGSKSTGEPRYVLIDCGVHDRETDGSKRLRQVMEHLVAATGGKLQVVVATHEHADHLSGFVQKGSPFLEGRIEIEELWVAWTEKIGDRQADRLRERFGCARKVIEKALEQMIDKARSNPRMAGVAQEVSGLTDFERPAEGSVDEADVLDRVERLAQTPEKAALLKALKGRLAPQPTMELGAAKKKREKPSSNELALALLMLMAKQVSYCEPKRMAPLTLPGDPGGPRAYVLGPPRDQDLLDQDKPAKVRGAVDESGEPQYKEVYLSRQAATRALHLAPALGTTQELGESKVLADDLRYPFKSDHRRHFTVNKNGKIVWTGTGESQQSKAIPERTKNIIERYSVAAEQADNASAKSMSQDGPTPDQSWRRIDGDWLGAYENLALDLDGDTNNTSLVLAFELGEPGTGPVLLFPGDAQVGNWLSWRDQSYRSGDRKFSADELMRRTVVYKVGHHGSHNATIKRDPRETTDSHEQGVPFGLELMESIIACIPVDRDAAEKKMPRPWKMPHLPLYRRLREKAQRRVLRSDLSMQPLDETAEDPDLTPSSEIWSRVPGMRNAKWRRSADQFDEGTPGPLFYDVLIEWGNG
jgi:hypothetical protein